MEIAVVGISYRTASVSVREKVSFTQSKKVEAFNQLLDQEMKEVIILSTCNRSEIYIADEDAKKKITRIKDFYKSFFHSENIEAFLFVKEGEEAIRHIYYVTSGLDSQVLGEDQILGQVKDAHQFAMDLGASGKILNKLFREAVTIGKQIKHETKISEYPLSISYIGIKCLKDKMRDLKDKKVLLVGMGKMNQLSLKYLEEENIKAIYVANRSFHKLQEIIKEYPRIIPVSYEKRYELLPQMDCVITCTAAPHIVFKLEEMPQLTKTLYMMDMAVPRDVAQEVELLEKVRLYNVDDFEAIGDENAEKRKELGKQAEKLIAKSMDEFQSWMHTIQVDPTICSLQQRCYQIQQDTMHCIEGKVKLSCKEKKLVEKMIGSSLKRLVREPIHYLKEIKDINKQLEYRQMMQELFGLEDE